jgi:hypothetical protein
VTLVLPIPPELREVIDATELGPATFLITDLGQSFASAESFGNKMRDWCDQAGLPKCTAHERRKAGATIAAENGAMSSAQGHLRITLKQPEVYTKAAEQKQLAESAMGLLVTRENAGN